MDGGTKTLLERADGPLDLADVAVGSDDVDREGVDIVTDALELAVSMESGEVETAGLVPPDDAAKFREEVALRAVRDADGRAILEGTTNGVEEGETLDEKKIGAQG